MSYTHWNVGEPSNRGAKCVEMWYFGHMKAADLGKWNDDFCAVKGCFLCEIDR